VPVGAVDFTIVVNRVIMLTSIINLRSRKKFIKNNDSRKIDSYFGRNKICIGFG